MLLVQQLVNGLMMGAQYAMIALGFALVFSVLRVLNLAHPEIFVVGAYLGLLASQYLIDNIIIALVVAMVGSALVVVMVQRFFLRPLKNPLELTPFVITIGIVIFIKHTLVYFFSARSISFPSLIGPVYYKLGELEFYSIHLITSLIAVVLLIAMKAFVNHTFMGRAIRATAEHPDVASCMGVNVDFVNLLTFSISSALGGAGGVLIGTMFGAINPFMGEGYGLKALVCMIVGGLGSLGGTIVAGFILGLAESLGVHLISASYRYAFAFGILIIVLLVRPYGIMGKKE